MAVAIVTGSGGLIGSESVEHFVEPASTWSASRTTCGPRSSGPRRRPARHASGSPSASTSSARSSVDIRDAEARRAACSPRSAAGSSSSSTPPPSPRTTGRPRDPQTDFGVNANGTLNLLEATRRHAPDATFVFCSTNKVYGDTPNRLPLEELGRAARAARRTTASTAASTRRCRSTARRTRCSASPRRRPTCWCRSTGATSTCRRSASAAAA